MPKHCCVKKIHDSVLLVANNGLERYQLQIQYQSYPKKGLLNALSDPGVHANLSSKEGQFGNLIDKVKKTGKSLPEKSNQGNFKQERIIMG